MALYTNAETITLAAEATKRGISMAVKKAIPNCGMGMKVAGAIIPLSRETTITPTSKLFLPIYPYIAANAAISIAITICIGNDNGKPANRLVKRWPRAAAAAPGPGPSNRAATKPGAESKATVPVGLGTFIKAPTALKAINKPIRAKTLVFC